MNLHFIGKEFERLGRLEDIIHYQYDHEQDNVSVRIKRHTTLPAHLPLYYSLSNCLSETQLSYGVKNSGTKNNNNCSICPGTQTISIIPKKK